jgi:hypothetical protein
MSSVRALDPESDVREVTTAARARLAAVGVALQELNCIRGRARWIVSERGVARTITGSAELQSWVDGRCGNAPVVNPAHFERERRSVINATNRRQDRLDEAEDFLRGPGGEL